MTMTYAELLSSAAVNKALQISHQTSDRILATNNERTHILGIALHSLAIAAGYEHHQAQNFVEFALISRSKNDPSTNH